MVLIVFYCNNLPLERVRLFSEHFSENKITLMWYNMASIARDELHISPRLKREWRCPPSTDPPPPQPPLPHLLHLFPSPSRPFENTSSVWVCVCMCVCSVRLRGVVVTLSTQCIVGTGSTVRVSCIAVNMESAGWAHPLPRVLVLWLWPSRLMLDGGGTSGTYRNPWPRCVEGMTRTHQVLFCCSIFFDHVLRKWSRAVRRKPVRHSNGEEKCAHDTSLKVVRAFAALYRLSGRTAPAECMTSLFILEGFLSNSRIHLIWTTLFYYIIWYFCHL